MAKCNLSAKELTVETFSPRVAVLCSPFAQSICDKNNLKFTQLIQPFTTLTTTLSWKEPNGGQIFPKNLKITPIDLASWKPPEPDTQKARNIQYSVVSQCVPPTLQLIKTFAAVSAVSSSNDDNTKNNSPDNTELSLQQLLLKNQKLGKRETGISLTDYDVVIPPSTPWFEAWREAFLKHFTEQQSSSQYEFLNQFTACILVISSCEGKTSDELSTIVGKLSKLQHQHQIEWPHNWFLPSVLKYYVILHDNSSPHSLSEAEANYQVLRSMYGGNFCYMLKVNSGNKDQQSVQDPWTYFINHEQHCCEPSPDVIEASENNEQLFNYSQIPHPLSPDTEPASNLFLRNGGENVVANNMNMNSKVPMKSVNSSIIRGQFMTNDDLENIQATINEFWGKSLFPYIERQCRLLHELIVNRRSMSKSFFGATKRLFGSSSKNPGSIAYPPDSSEMMSRKLADLYFLFGHYAGAYQLYHQLKKDFQADQAWPYYACSLEMAAISHFMMTQTDSSLAQGARSFPAHYIQEAIRCYLENCRMTDAAIRCAIICCECLKQLENFAEAATVLIRMTSGDCDLRSALMLEQAAYAFVQLNSPRKYALHSVLAGHRFNKAGLKYHSLNSYLQAGKVFFGRGWRLAEDHIHFTIGKQQAFLNLHTNILDHFKSLLTFPTPPAQSQVELYYKEFLQISSKLYDENKVLQEFFIPKILSSDIKVRVGTTGLQGGHIQGAGELQSTLEASSTATSLDSIEEQIVKECIDTSVIFFKPFRLYFDHSTDNTIHPTVPCNEPFYVEVPFHNPLLITVIVQNITLHFETQAVSSSIVQELNLSSGETKYVRFEVFGNKKGRYSFDWIYYELRYAALCTPFRQKINVKGPRLNTTKAERHGKIYGKDLRNKCHIIEEMPLLQAELEGLPNTLIQSQTANFNIVLHDKSKNDDQRQRISKLYVSAENMSELLEVSNDSSSSFNRELENKQRNYCPINLSLDGSSTIKIPCVFKAPQLQSALLNILVLYQVNPVQDSTEEKESHPTKKSLFSLYRVTKVALNIPLISSFKLDFSFLKSLNNYSFMGLLKIENVMQMGQLDVDKISFEKCKYEIDEHTSGTGSLTKYHKPFNVGSFESRNIILKIFEKVNQSVEGNENQLSHKVGQLPESKESLSICLSWRFSLVSSSNSYISHSDNNNKSTASGVFKLKVDKESVQRKSNSVSATISANEVKLFHFIAKHSSQNTHNFNKTACFVLPVELEIYSCWTGKIHLTIAFSENEAEAEMEPSKLSTLSGVIFVGQTKWTLDVKQFERQILFYQVAITKPGVYNVAPKITLSRVLNSDDGELEAERYYLLHSPAIIAHEDIQIV